MVASVGINRKGSTWEMETPVQSSGAISSRLQKTSMGAPKFHWPARIGQQENRAQDAQKGQTSHPPTLARQDAPCLWQGRSSEAGPRFTFHASRFTVPGSDARTPLADFFSILLGIDKWSSKINEAAKKPI